MAGSGYRAVDSGYSRRGISSCWVLLFDPAAVRKSFDLPPYIVPVCLLPIGYAAPGARPYAPWHDTFSQWLIQLR